MEDETESRFNSKKEREQKVQHTLLLLVAGGVEAPVGEELKRRDDELAGPGPGRRAILVSTDRRSAVLAAAAISPWQHRPTDPIFDSSWRLEVMMVNPRKQRTTASPLHRAD